MKFGLTIVLLTTIGFISMAQSSSTVIIRQTTHAYTLTTPEGWLSDEENAQSMMIDMAFHPDTTKWTKAPVVMYSTITHKTSPDQLLEKVIEMDVVKFLENSPGAVSKTKKELMTFPQKKRAIIVEFRNEQLKNFESVAFVEEDYYVIMIVIGSRDPKFHDENQPAFEALVQSYFNLAE